MSDDEPDDALEFSERMSAFVNLGFDEVAALALAWDVSVSVSQVRELVRHGCSPATAAQIVL